MLDWAKREVEIACKKENPNRKDGEYDYGCACYESALKAFETLCDDGLSGLNIKITQSILNRLIDGKPIKVYCEDFLTDKKNGDFDTVGVFYALKTENDKQEKIEINRFFRAPKDDEVGRWTEISKEEYMQRKDKRLNTF